MADVIFIQLLRIYRRRVGVDRNDSTFSTEQFAERNHSSYKNWVIGDANCVITVKSERQAFL